MLFTRNNRVYNLNIKLNNVLLVIKTACKNLGILLDCHLRFSGHVSNIIQKCIFKLKLLYLSKDILDPNIKLTLSNSLVLSHLAYCNIVFWPALLQKDKDSLQKLQNYCLRFVYNLRKYDQISQYFLQSGWFNIKERFEIQFARFIYKVIHSKQPVYLFEKLVTGSSIHDRQTRHRDMFCVPRHSTAFFQRSFTYNATKLYNSLPMNVREAPTLATFGKKLKQYIFLQEGFKKKYQLVLFLGIIWLYNCITFFFSLFMILYVYFVLLHR